MTFKKWTVGVAGACLLAAAQPASADLNSYVTGGWAYRSGADKTVNIKDTLGNNQGVYVVHRRSGDQSDRRLDNRSGYGTTVSTTNSIRVIGLKACQDIPFQSDACDSWKNGT